MEGGSEEKRQFVVPKKEELIESIKELDDDIEHVSLNLIKCDFNATEKDVKKTFPEYHFIKVKNYNPGSFEVVFETKIDAIHFIKDEFDKKILARRFFIKMGRQQKERIENWTAVGHVPPQFRHTPKHSNSNRKSKEGGDHKTTSKEHHPVIKEEKQHKEDEDKEHEHKEEKGHKEYKEERRHKEREEHKEVKEPKENKDIKESEPISKPSESNKDNTQKPKQGKVIPKVEHKKRSDKNKGKQEGDHKKEDKKEEKKVEKKEDKKEEKAEGPKDQKKGNQKKEEEKPVEETKEEDDGWIVVPPKKGKKK